MVCRGLAQQIFAYDLVCEVYMCEVYQCFVICVKVGEGGVLAVMYVKHENTCFPPAHVKSIKIIYPPGVGVPRKMMGGLFL